MTTKTFQKKRPRIPLEGFVEFTLRSAADRAVSRCRPAPFPATILAAFAQEVRSQPRPRDR